MHFVYILFSKKINRFYTGETARIDIRLDQHKEHYFPTNFTKNANDWQLVFTYTCLTKGDAIYLERFIKRMKSSSFIKRIIKKPEILDDILSKRN